MSDNTIIQQGYFTSTGVDKYIPLRSDADWVKVYNLNNIAGDTQWAGLTWYWQRGMTNGDAITEYHAANSQAVSMSTCAVGYNGATYGGIYLYDTSNQSPSAAVATTAGTNATQPVYSTATTTGLTPGTIVRIASTAHTNLNGLDFSIDTIVAATSFRLANTLATAPGVVAGAGTYRIVAPNLAAYKIFAPSSRVIANITQAANAVVTTLVDHGYVAGERVRFSNITSMTQINGLIGTIVTTPTAATFTVDIDTTGFTAFSFPLPATVPLTHPQVVPVGDGPVAALAPVVTSSVPFGATYNQSTLGILLGTSSVVAVALGSAGGSNGDVIKWVAGKSFAYNIP